MLTSDASFDGNSLSSMGQGQVSSHDLKLDSKRLRGISYFRFINTKFCDSGCLYETAGIFSKDNATTMALRSKDRLDRWQNGI